MSRASMTVAATALPRAPLFGIASCPVGPDLLEFEIGWDEVERDVEWAETLLRSAGLRAGDMVLITVNSWEAPWTAPVVRAMRRIGVVYITAEVWGFDARRTSMFLQRLPIKAIFGLCADTLTGLEADEIGLPELLNNVEIVWARPDAAARLADASVTVLQFILLGPALGLGVPGRPGVMVNGAEWKVETDNGELVVSNMRQRAATFDQVPTGLRGSVRSTSDGALSVQIEN
jgi:hypothetical protein